VKRVLIPAALACLVALVSFVAVSTPAPAATNAEVGAAPNGRHGYEFIGRVDQNGANFVSYGYLTYVYGISTGLLYSSPTVQTEATARLTYYTTATLTSRNVLGSIFVVNSAGYTTFYYNDVPSGNFTNSATFNAGTAIATGSVRFHDVLNVQAPNVGIATCEGEMDQLTSTPFVIGGVTNQLGYVGLVARISTTGEGTRTDPIAPASFTNLAGSAVVTSPRTVALPVVAR
jgi:hypothetical protein